MQHHQVFVLQKKKKNGVSIIQIFVISILLGWEQIDRGRLRLNPQINPTRSGYQKKKKKKPKYDVDWEGYDP